MIRVLGAVAVLAVLAAAPIASAQPVTAKPVPITAPPAGWVQLGEIDFDPRPDTGTMPQGTRAAAWHGGTLAGRLTSVAVVLDRPLDVDRTFILLVEDDYAWETGWYLATAHGWRISLPVTSSGVHVNDVRFDYQPIAGALAMHATIWGEPATGPAPAGFDASGWTLLADTSLDGRHHVKDEPVGADRGRFSQLVLVPMTLPAKLGTVEVVLDGEKRVVSAIDAQLQPRVASRVIDLGKKPRAIQSIRVGYDHHGTPPRLAIFGR